MKLKKQDSHTQKIEVAIRMRPLLSQFEDQPAWSILSPHSISSIQRVTSSTPSKKRYVEGFCNYKYNFDFVFDHDTNTQEIYQQCCLKMIDSFLAGDNTTIFMYGQTTSGKTYTMLGDTHCEGLIIYSLKDIFRKFPKANLTNKNRITISYLEIYNEQINDLLSPGSVNLKIQEDTVQGLKQCEAQCFEETRELLMKGEEQRSYKEKSMHDHSSRSHTIFQIRINDVASGKTRCCLNLVDLAGSERLTDEDRLNDSTEETGYINKSLFVLSNVISKLAKSSKKTHIPFRDSKLTRLLSNCLIGKSHTMIICTVSPAAMNFYQTLSTLRFATNAKKVERQLTISEDSFDKENKDKGFASVKELQTIKEQMSRLKRTLKETQGREETLKAQLEECFYSTKNASSVLTKDTKRTGVCEKEFLSKLKQQVQDKMCNLPLSWVRKSSDLCCEYSKNIDILQYKYKMALFNIAETQCSEFESVGEVIKEQSNIEVYERIRNKDIFDGLAVSVLLNCDCEAEDVTGEELEEAREEAKKVLGERFMQLKKYLSKRQEKLLLNNLEKQFQEKTDIIEQAYRNVCRIRGFPN